MTTVPVSLIVAKESNNGIGFNGDLLFRIKKDMSYFKDITSNVSQPNLKNAVIMGRKTWLSIPPKFRPLENRQNVVLTRSNLIEKGKDTESSVMIENSLRTAIDKLKEMPDIEEIFIIGGYQIYREAIENNLIDKLYITQISYSLPSEKIDTFLPDIDYSQWKLVESSQKYTQAVLIVPLNIREDITFNFNVYHKTTK